MSSVGSSSGRSSSEKRKCKSPQAVPPPKDSTQFEKIADPIAGDLKVICNFCARLFQFRADEKEFDSLKTHFDNKHCTKIRNEASKAEAEAEPQHSSGEYTKLLAKFICYASVSLITAECDLLLHFLSKACNPPPPKIPRIVIIHEIVKHVRESLLLLKKDFVKLSIKVSICCDVWNSEFEQQFLRISCHWVDESWNIQKRLIAFRRMVHGCFEYRDALCSFFAEQQFEDVQLNLAQFEACSNENTPIPSLIVANVKKCLYDLFQEYSMKHGASSGMNLSSGSHSDEIPLLERLQNLYFDVSEKRPRCYGTNPYGELETYLTARFEYIVEPEFDILKWWSRMTMQFPVMSLIAKGILAAPALTVSVEQAFGTGGYALDWNLSNYLCRRPRSPLVENQLLLGDWTRAEDRNQENDYDNGYMSEEIYDWELDDY
ncbi:hypothetical protein SASPL_130948 [Salvia splendens]|uniref:HAT C-terminal dimerisation domain-containing protein n=1 Tax=Salvia splendens TaxID=180675 RepID=A0A8X8X7V7_SALSN|nr:hypothetical protein SASPL_130948 [Salvia splendens]